MPQFEEIFQKIRKQTQKQYMNPQNQEMKFNFSIIKQIILNLRKKYEQQMKKKQQFKIQRGKPPILEKKYRLILTIILTLIMTFLNSEELFFKQQLQATALVIQEPQLLDSKINLVFQKTIFNRSLYYPIKIQECQPFLPMFQKQLCKNKILNIRVKLTYLIGYKPDFNKMSFNIQNYQFYVESSQLQILNYVVQDQILDQSVNALGYFKISQYKQKLNKTIEMIRPFAQQKINENIQELNNNPNQLKQFNARIFNWLSDISNEHKKKQITYANKLMKTINKSFNKALELFNIQPINKVQEKKQQKRMPIIEEQIPLSFSQDIFLEQEEIQRKIKSKQDKVKKAQNESQNIQKKQNVKQNIQNTKEYNEKQAQEKLSKLQRKLSKK